MRTFVVLLLLPLSSHWLSAQCDSTTIYGNDSIPAVCFDTAGNVLIIHSNNLAGNAEVTRKIIKR